MKAAHIFFLSLTCCLAFTVLVRAQDSSAPPAAVKGFKAFPFIVDTTDVQFDLSVNLNDPTLKSQFGDLFRSHAIPFDEDSWEIFVLLLIEKGGQISPAGITDFWDEPVLYFQSGGPANRQVILDKVRPLFYDRKALEALMPELKERLDL